MFMWFVIINHFRLLLTWVKGCEFSSINEASDILFTFPCPAKTNNVFIIYSTTKYCKTYSMKASAFWEIEYLSPLYTYTFSADNKVNHINGN